MKFSVLASGSKGNCTFIQTPKAKILVDAGMSCAYIERNLRELYIEPNEIDAIIITHTHKDHINGLKVFAKRYQPNIYLTEKMKKELNIELNNIRFINDIFYINDIKITPIKTSHDVADSNGYIIESNEKSIVYITDTGYINNKNHKNLSNKDYYIFESNYDVDLLMHGKYPYYLQQRIHSDKGHLSNEESSYYLSEFVSTKTEGIVLAHLSEENNKPNIALNTLEQELKRKHKKIASIEVAQQDKRTELIKV